MSRDKPLACDRFLAWLALNNILLKVSSFAPYSGIYRTAAPLSDFAPVCIRGPTLIRKLFSANPARLAQCDGPPTADESLIFLFEELSRPEGGPTVTEMESLYATSSPSLFPRARPRYRLLAAIRPSKAARRRTDQAAKLPREMPLVEEAERTGNGRKRQIGLHQQLSCSLDALLQHVAMR